MKNLLSTIFLLTLPAMPSTGQSLHNTHRGEQHINWFSESDIGIDHMQIWAITEGVDGYIFAATNDGLSIFDGIRWRLVKDHSNIILRALYFDKVSGRLYSAGVNTFGFWTMDDYGETIYTPLFKNDNVREQSIDFWRIVSRQNGNTLYIQAHSALYLYNITSGTLIEIKLPYTEEIGFCHSCEDSVLIQVGDSLYLLNEDNTLKEICTTLGRIMSIFSHQQTLILAVEHCGLFELKDNRLLPVNKALNGVLSKAKINCVIPLQSDYMIGTTREGLIAVDSKWNIIETTAPSVKTQTILSMYVDSQSNIWLGFNSGIARIDTGSNERYIRNEAFGQVASVLQQGQAMLIATNKGAFRVENGAIELIPNTLGACWKLLQIEQNVFMLHDRGLFLLGGSGIKPLSQGGVTDIVQMSGESKDYWVACNYNGLSLYKYRDQALEFVSKIEGYNSFPRGLMIDHFNNLWFAVSGFGFQRLRLTDDKIAVAENHVYKIEFDADASQKTIFITTLNGENLFYANNKVYKYDLQSDSMVPDPRTSNLMSVCGKNLLTIEQQDNRIWYISQDDIGFLELVAGQVIKYSGLFEQSQKGRISPRIMSANNNIVIGFNNGIGIIPGNTQNHKAQKIRIGRVEAVGINKSILHNNRDEIFNIPHSMNNLKIYPVLIPRGTKVDYRIIGVDPAWKTLKITDHIAMSALPSGYYTIELRPSGVDDPAIYTAVKINIARPWYISNTAITLYILALIAIFFGIRAYYIRSNRKHQARLKVQQQEIFERAKLTRDKQIAELQKEQIQNELRNKDKRLANITMNNIKRNNILNGLKSDLMDVQNQDNPIMAQQRIAKVVRKINSQLSNEEDWEQSESYFNTIYDGLLDRLRQNYHTLTKTDLKLCVYIKLNHTTKEMAELMNISPRSIEMARYRLRKKLGLKPTEPIENILK